MKIELHIIQNFAPSCLNRDDTGSPKDCEFGGYRRARISSQCFKRAIRQTFAERELVPKENLGIRTRLLIESIADVLAQRGRDHAAGVQAAKAALASIKLVAKASDAEDGPVRTQYLLYVPRRIVERSADIVEHNWQSLTAATAGPADDDTAKKTTKKKKAKKAQGGGLGGDALKELAQLYDDSSMTPDIALFGRMIADNADFNVNAAVQVAHAISTHRIAMEFDFYTAVDDLQTSGETGAGMMGTTQFSAPCLYRFAVLNTEELTSNLVDDLSDPDRGAVDSLARRTTQAFLRGAIEAIPTGKQNSMAAHNLPAFVLAVVRSGGATMSLANAFVEPVRAGHDGDLVKKSVVALDAHLGNAMRMYGCDGVEAAIRCALDPKVTSLVNLGATDKSPLDAIRERIRHVDSIVDLVDGTAKVAFGGAT